MISVNALSPSGVRCSWTTVLGCLLFRAAFTGHSISVGLHALFNYVVVFYQKGMLTIVQVETYVAVFAVIITAVVFWLSRTRRGGEEINGDDSGVDVGIKEEIAAGETVEKLISKRVVNEDENNGIEN